MQIEMCRSDSAAVLLWFSNACCNQPFDAMQIVPKNKARIAVRALVIIRNAKLNIMNDKCTLLQGPAQHLIAGLVPGSEDIEFYGIPETKEVRWLQNGQDHAFKDLSPRHYMMLLNAYMCDASARRLLESITDSSGRQLKFDVTKQVMLYTYYCYGDLDSQPDIKNGKLQPAENYRHERECISLQFDSKEITLNGIPLKNREIRMIDSFSQEDKDEIVALELGIVRHTLNQHKKKLFQKAGVYSKIGLVVKAFEERILISRAV